MPTWFEMRPGETFTQWFARINEGTAQQVADDERRQFDAEWERCGWSR